MNEDIICPTGKIRFRTAIGAWRNINKAKGKRRPERTPHRAYFCKECQGFHLTAEHMQGNRPRSKTLDS